MKDFEELIDEDEGFSEACIDELKKCNLATIPENSVLSIFESNFPECQIRREGEALIVEISEHIYSKYWWHKYHARVFADAMVRAVKRLAYEKHPFFDAGIESDDDVHIFIRWKMILPTITSNEVLIESISTAFDLVWERANSILENSDSILLLGKDTGDSLVRLKNIATLLENQGYHVYIIKEEPDKIGESIIQKVLRYALSSKFIIIENSEPSGHLYEIPHVTKMAECVTVVLQEQGKGATWMFEDAYGKYRNWKKFVYAKDSLKAELITGVKWAEDFIEEFGKYQKRSLPWMSEK